MLNKKLMMLTIFFACLLAVSAVSAAENATEDIITDVASEDVVSVENNNQTIEQTENEEISTADDGTFTALQNKINNAESGSTITLENDYIYDDGFDTNGIRLSKSLIIDGQGHTLNGLSKSRIFNVTGVHGIGLYDIKFKNGYSENNGGAINMETNIVPYEHPVFNIINCEFDNNVASRGGAISSEISFVTLENCIFNNNVATGRGGGLYFYYGGLNQKSCSILNCDFINNHANLGGGIFSECEKLQIKNSRFNNNSAYDGGAIYIIHSWTSSGGSYIGGKKSNIFDCEFNYNSALNYGGAIYVDAERCTLDSCVFNYNMANFGYAVQWNGHYGSITNCKSVTTYTNKIGNMHVTGVGATMEGNDAIIITIFANDVVCDYLNSKISAKFYDGEGEALSNAGVTFKIGTTTYTATTNTNGVATASVELGAGTYTVTAINPVNNEQKQFKLVIDKANSAIALASSQNNGVTTLTATLTPAAASGNVIFNVNGEDKSAAIKNGKATLTLSDLEPGDYAVTASYNGDKNLKASTSNAVTFNVAEVYPILTADPVTKTYGTSTKLVVNLVDSKGNAIANADVNVNINGQVTPITTDSNGQATMSINKAPGSYTAAIAYADAQTTAKITVKKATPKLTAKAKTFKKSVKTKKYTVTLKTNQNKVMKNTKVTLKVNGKTYSAKTNTKGQATFKITKLTKKGKFTATIKYAGSKYYNAKTVKAKITVK